jgi:dihydroflavonol-4-reductase
MVVIRKTVLVTGGTGKIGRKVVSLLLTKNYHVYVLSRKHHKNKNNITYLTGDINSNFDLKKCDYFIHLAACLDGSDKKCCYSTNVEGTKNILKLAQKLKIKKLVYTSTISVFKNSGQNIRDESWKKVINTGNHYIDSKLHAEEEVKLSPVPTIIVYPTLVLDLKDRGEPHGNPVVIWLWKLSGGFNGSLSGLFGKGDRILNYVIAEDVAEGIVLALEKGSVGENYILGGENIKIVDYLKKMSKYYKTYTLPIRLPDFLSKPKALFFSSRKAETKLGYNPKNIDGYLKN